MLSMVMALIHGVMATNTLVSGEVASVMDLAHISGKMATCILDNIQMIYVKVKAHFTIKMGRDTLETSKTTKKVEMEPISMKMVISILVSGNLTCAMVLVHTLKKTVKSKSASGRTEIKSEKSSTQSKIQLL